MTGEIQADPHYTLRFHSHYRPEKTFPPFNHCSLERETQSDVGPAALYEGRGIIFCVNYIGYKNHVTAGKPNGYSYRRWDGIEDSNTKSVREAKRELKRGRGYGVLPSSRHSAD